MGVYLDSFGLERQNFAPITVGACSALGRIVGSGTVALSWADPDDVTLNGATLATWQETRLVRKAGSYPAAYNDGTLIASTSLSAGTKNYYRDTAFTDTPPSGVTSYYALFSISSTGVWNALAANRYPIGESSYSWYNIRAAVRSGTASTLFPVGTVFTVSHSEYSHPDGTSLKFRVVGYDLMNPVDETLTHSMLLDMVDCLFTAPYDAPEYLYALTADTTAISGKTYYTLSGSTYTALVEGTDWNPGDVVPAASWYEKNSSERNASGNNNSVQSNLIQWMNSSGLANQWFTKQNIWDKCDSALLGKNGFCRNIDSEFLSVVAPATLKTVLCNYDGGGIVTHTAKFFPLSNNQIYSQNPGENVYIPYFDTSNKRKKILCDGTAVIDYWLRTPRGADSFYTFFVSNEGIMSNTSSKNSLGVSLACIIA